MEKFDANAKMEHLIKTLDYYTKLYDMGTPAITDAEWDKMYFELADLERHYPSLIRVDSPTQKIKYEVVSELKKVKHEYQPMLSLDKTKDIEDIKDFIGDRNWIAMLKLDGLTCRLTYEDGYLVRAETRGNGIEGEDVTHNAMVIPSIPKRIDYLPTLVVDGEMICFNNDFEQFKNDYANSRNFSAGSIRLLDSKECAKRKLTFVAWDIITKCPENITPVLSEKLEWLYRRGFLVVPSLTPFEVETIDEAVWFLQNSAKANGIPIDGLVFKWNNCAEYESAGRTEHHFRGGLAYKFYDEEYETTLLDIEWTMGRTGVLTPVAVYKPIEIEGSECNRASLHNLNTMWDLLSYHPYYGQPIWIYKAHQIIPQISRSEYSANGSEPIELKVPNYCPVCGGVTCEIESDTGTIELFCVNPDCSGKLINVLDHFCGKKGLDVKGLSKATLGKLIEWDWVKNIKDLFYLHQYRREWINKPGFGEKSVDNIIAAFEKARHCTLEAYISALGIPLIGSAYAKILAKQFKTYTNFRNAVAGDFDFSSLEGFGEAKHKAIVNYDYYIADRLYDMNFVEIIADEPEPEISASPLDGKIFCITGKLHGYPNRDALKNYIVSLGGKVADSVSGKTSYLINNDINSTTGKNKKAKELNIPIITEEKLEEIINGTKS